MVSSFFQAQEGVPGDNNGALRTSDIICDLCQLLPFLICPDKTTCEITNCPERRGWYQNKLLKHKALSKQNISWTDTKKIHVTKNIQSSYQDETRHVNVYVSWTFLPLKNYNEVL